jgi:hypothetical protein
MFGETMREPVTTIVLSPVSAASVCAGVSAGVSCVASVVSWVDVATAGSWAKAGDENAIPAITVDARSDL